MEFHRGILHCTTLDLSVRTVPEVLHNKSFAKPVKKKMAAGYTCIRHLTYSAMMLGSDILRMNARKVFLRCASKRDTLLISVSNFLGLLQNWWMSRALISPTNPQQQRFL